MHAPALAVVRDGLRLIERGYLDGRSVGDLAALLSVSERHLTRLFVQHVGATPAATARTRRVQAAKRLLDESTLPITDIAFAAGFSSLRRFNAVFAEVYGCPPSRIRRALPPSGDRAGLVARLGYRPPLDWTTLLRLLAVEATPGVERVSPDEYCRAIRLGDQAGWLTVTRDDGRDSLCLTMRLPDTRRLHGIVERVRAMFDLGANPRRIAAQLGTLSAATRAYDQIVAAVGAGARLPGAWDGFEVAIRALLALEVGAAAATTIMGRLVTEYGTRLVGGSPGEPAWLFPAPATIAGATLTDAGVSAHTAERIRHLAEAVRTGALCFQATTFDRLTSGLVQIAGLDRATAHWIGLRTLGEPDAEPFGTPAVAGLGDTDALSETDLAAARPWRSYVAVAMAAAGESAGIRSECGLELGPDTLAAQSRATASAALG
jgi:AraC family transcriptional regulator of adaptative response / DNA-3-methyladenine glycosylase II